MQSKVNIIIIHNCLSWINISSSCFFLRPVTGSIKFGSNCRADPLCLYVIHGKSSEKHARDLGSWCLLNWKYK